MVGSWFDHSLSNTYFSYTLRSVFKSIVAADLEIKIQFIIFVYMHSLFSRD